MATNLTKDVYVANITEAGPGHARVVLREGDPPESNEDQVEPGRDWPLVLPATEVPRWGEKLTMSLRGR